MGLVPKFPKSAGTVAEFREWREKLQREYPVRYKINEALTWLYRRLFLFPMWRLRDAKWWVLHRVHPKHRYHVHKAKSLTPGYHDTDTLILHHAFDLFAKFMKRQLDGKSFVKWTDFQEEIEGGHMDQQEADEREQTWKEMVELYQWWTEVYPRREDKLDEDLPMPKLPEEWGWMSPLDDKYRDTPQVQEWSRINSLRSKEEARWIEEDTNNLIRLAKIRKSLWD